MKKVNLKDFADDLKQRRRVGDDAPVMLLGAGVSAGAGVVTMNGILKFFKYSKSQFQEFEKHIQGLDEDERYRKMNDLLQRKPPTKVSPGYKALATLIESDYFDIILSLNFDPLLDDALASARMRRRDYILLVNGIIRQDWFDRLIRKRTPRVKVIKLHGDLFHRCMAWTTTETESFLSDIKSSLEKILDGRDIVIIGTPLNGRQHKQIRDLILRGDKTIWYINRGRKIPDFLVRKDKVRVIVGKENVFEKFFPKLAYKIERRCSTR